ncbi:MAG TPA: ribosome small subunit-dependent GTPase A [Kofleriaceae bacterium]
MTLEELGWDPSWPRPADGGTIARIVAEHRGAYHARAVDGVAWAEATGKAFLAASRDKRELPTVGDWVVLDRWTEALAGAGAAVIRAILPRNSLLVRRAAGEASLPQPLAANVDIGLVMTSANGDLSPARLDRYLTLLADSQIPAAIVLSKVDLVGDPSPVVELLGTLAPNVPILPVSTVSGAGLAELRALVPPRSTAVLLGSSGVGKSSLLNLLVASAALPTKPIDDNDRGRHATTRREMFIADDGSLWIDTPGMRELARWAVEDQDDEEEDAFDDIAALAANCRFRDCNHENEPGCAVVEAITDGELEAIRLVSFHKLGEEHQVAVTKQKAAKRIAETQRAKAKKYAPRPGKPDDER